jgi:phospholipid/cholesterol/gamma-HCH transport system ATP-binding protein
MVVTSRLYPATTRRGSAVSGSVPYFKFDHVSIAFGETLVLDDVSFQVMPGETLCLMGRSGVGKSVSLRIFMGFLKPSAGRMISAQEDITEYAEEELVRIRKNVTMVFQDGALFDSLTLAENVAFPLRERGGFTEERIEKIVDMLLNIVRIKHLRNLLPSEISTGMKRAVAIARALAAGPAAVLYDEPTSMVDPLMARSLGDLIQHLKSQLGLTSIVVTHDTRLARNVADRAVFLDHGRVVFSGSIAEAENSPVAIVRDFWGLDRIDWRELLPRIDTRLRIAA